MGVGTRMSAVLALPSLALAFTASTVPQSPPPVPRLDLLQSAMDARAIPSNLSSRLIDATTSSASQRVPLTRTEVEVILEGLAAPDRAAISGELDRAALPQDYRGSAVTEALTEDFGDWQKWGHTFRRVVALRQNRVLMPARAAQLYTALMSACMHAQEDAFAVQVLEYVGLTPRQYLIVEDGTIDLQDLGHTVCKTMLDLNVEMLEWDLVGKTRGQDQPMSSREKNEDIAEWHWSQIMPVGGTPELEFRACDMILSVLRLSLRYAPTVGVKDVRVKLQTGTEDDPYTGLTRRGFLLPLEAVKAVTAYNKLAPEPINVKIV